VSRVLDGLIAEVVWDGDRAEVVEDVRQVAGRDGEVSEHPVGDSLVLEHKGHRRCDVEAASR
jgi:hypothetical protein